MTEEIAIAIPELSTIQLVSQARRALAEARTLGDFHKVVELASIASDANARAAKLMEAEGVALEIVQAASEAANDAAAVRIEAQAGAGHVLRQMAERGERAGQGGWRSRRSGGQVNTALTSHKPSLRELIGPAKSRQGANQQAARWMKVADISPTVRAGYVDKMKDEGGEITTLGLLKFAAEPKEDAPDLDKALGEVYRLLGILTAYDPGVIAGHATNTRQKGKLTKRVRAGTKWLDTILRIYGAETKGDGNGNDESDREASSRGLRARRVAH